MIAIRSSRELARFVVDRLSQPGPDGGDYCRLLAVTGVDCAGKSTLASHVRATCSERGIAVTDVSIDDFFIPPGKRVLGATPSMEYYEYAFDYPAFAAAVATAECRIKTADSHIDAGGRPAPSRSVLVAEGVFLLRRELRTLWDFVVWLEIDRRTMIRRAMARDAEYFGSPLAAARAYVRRCIPAQQIHLANDAPVEQADLIARRCASGWRVHSKRGT